MPSSFPGCSNTVTWSHVATTGRKVVRPHPPPPPIPWVWAWKTQAGIELGFYNLFLNFSRLSFVVFAGNVLVTCPCWKAPVCQPETYRPKLPPDRRPF
jgi:hypothetical protein